jgi:hypothetical protein
MASTVAFRGVLTFALDSQPDAERIVEYFQTGMEGQYSDWPKKFNLGDFEFKTFKITDVRVAEDTATIKFDFTVENTTGMPIEQYVSAIKEDFLSLEGIDTPDFFISRARASQVVSGGRKRRTRRGKKHVRKTKRRY